LYDYPDWNCSHQNDGYFYRPSAECLVQKQLKSSHHNVMLSSWSHQLQ